MLPDKFRIAMFNRLGIGPYFLPARTDKSAEEWLIIERSGTNGDYLVISNAEATEASTGYEAPADLVETRSIFGILIDIAPSGEEATFLFTRNLVGEQSVSGHFFPADGYATLERYRGQIQLRAAGRYAHETDGKTRSGIRGPAFRHIPEPTPAAHGTARNWHCNAIMRPWINQCLDEPAHLELL